METINADLVTQVANINNERRATSFRWRGLSVTVRGSINLREYVSFIQTVLHGCTDPETGDFHIELFDLVFMATVVMMFTNIELPADLETQFKILFWTDLYNEVCLRISEAQLESLRKTVERYVAK